MKKTKKNNGNQPDIKTKCGVFQLCAWKSKKVVPARNDFDVERTFERINICLSVGQKKNGGWENIPVWFRRSQFGDLKGVVDEFAEKLMELNGSVEGGDE